MRHQKLHLVRQYAAVAQYEVFPQRGCVRGVEQGHACLLRCAVGFAVVTGFASCHDIHPTVQTVLSEGNDVFAGEVGFVKIIATVGAQIAITGKQFAVGQARLEIKRVDAGNALVPMMLLMTILDCMPVTAL